MSSGGAMFVQFPHPQKEHDPRGARTMPWNVGEHGRKFLATTGDLVDRHHKIDHDVKVACWAEWEPPSDVEHRWKRECHLPRALHRPWWTLTASDVYRQNTDPWIFGDRMRYSNCKQLTSHRNPSSMQKLHRGSVICFGSTIDGEFCVDTVFVVASARPLRPADSDELDVDDAFRTCVVDALASGDLVCATGCTDSRRGCSHCHNDSVMFTLYEGATFDDRVEGMYSFVPAVRLGDDPDSARFPRPAIDGAGHINPKSVQSTKGSNDPLAPERVRELWDEVREQVLEANLRLAVRLETPARHDAAGTRTGRVST